MAEYRDVRRIAPWWMCALVLVIFNFFAWMIWVNAAAPVKEGVYTRVPIPPFFLFAYLTLACLFNRRSVIATREGVRLSNFPVPLLSGETIPADRITLCYYYSVMTTSDGGGEPFAIGHVIGVETRDGRQVDLSEQFKTLIEAR
ncbi:MAG TPA: hypothetical protein VER03_07925, partial [Bryobacteraceae bacterium]|nr:hypothetical protein [Bryobacteraceae bacterium]